MALSWTAIRRGAIYCAPACGHRCTWAAYQEAKRKARALCKRLGKGWTPIVSENMGWHYKAKKGFLEVHEWPGGTFTCFVQTNPQFVSDHRTDPKKAVLRGLAAFDAHLKSLNEQRALLEP